MLNYECAHAALPPKSNVCDKKELISLFERCHSNLRPGSNVKTSTWMQMTIPVRKTASTAWAVNAKTVCKIGAIKKRNNKMGHS